MRATVGLARDFEEIRMFAILTDETEIRDFRENFATSANSLTILSLADLLSEHIWTDSRSDIVNKLAKEIEAVSKGWAPKRVMQALKKFLGLEAMHRLYGCEHARVLDSESMPLRTFSFMEVFVEFERNPRILATNLSDSSIHWDKMHAALTRKSSEGLGLPANASFNNLSYRSTDFWMFSLVHVSQLMTYVSDFHDKSFVYVFTRYPAGVPVYYGNFMRNIMLAEKYEVLLSSDTYSRVQ